MARERFLLDKRLEKSYYIYMVKNIIIVICIIFLLASVKQALALNFSPSKKQARIMSGQRIFMVSGCMKCHSLVAGDNIKGIDSLAGFGDRGLTIRETEQAIRSCKADVYCTKILTDKQVRDISYYLNSLLLKKSYFSSKTIKHQ